MSIFKSCDIRGVYGQELDEETAYRLGRAVGTRLCGREVVVGGDLRPSTSALMAALIDGLLHSGAQVIALGILPTPAFYDAKRRLRAPGAVMVTASHNPARYNGFKVMLDELPVTPEDVQALAHEMAAGHFAEGRGQYRRVNLLDDYVDDLCSAFEGLVPRRVVVDAGNGSMSTVAPELLRRLGQEVVALYCTPDGAFPNRDPNPAIPQHLTVLQRRVVETGAGIASSWWMTAGASCPPTASLCCWCATPWRAGRAARWCTTSSAPPSSRKRSAPPGGSPYGKSRGTPLSSAAC